MIDIIDIEWTSDYRVSPKFESVSSEKYLGILRPKLSELSDITLFFYHPNDLDTILYQNSL